MLIIRMTAVAFKLAWPHLLTPWRSPLLRWRLETYGVLDERGKPLAAKDITAKVFWHFVCSHPRTLWQFLRWAATLKQCACAPEDR